MSDVRTRGRGDRVLGLAFVAGLLALLAGMVLLAVVLIFQGVDRANAWAGVVSAGVALAGGLVTLVTWWLRQRVAAGKPVTSDQLAQATEGLHAAVFEQWRREARARSLGDPDPMPVRWRLSDPAVMDHEEHIASSVPLRFSGRSDRIPALTDQFRKLRRRRLVIIGPPGSGKTTLAVQLLLQLLEGWQAGEPVPVLFSLSSWDPQAQPEVQDWLAGQLAQTYPDLRAFGAGAAQKLADQERLLPILDGLDEIPTERRGEVIDRLNASLHPGTGLILTSRTTEYTETAHTTDVLTAAAVIEPEQLTSTEAARYMEDRLPRRPDDSWQAVLTALRSGTAEALAEVVASPLGLWLLRVVHIEGRRDPRPLIDPSHYSNGAAIQHHLLDKLIPAVVHSRPPLRSAQDPLRPTHHHDPDQIRRWLTTLAIELRDAQISDWRWWQLARHTLTPRQIRLAFGLMLGLMGGLVYGLWGALAVGLEGWLTSGLPFGLVYGLVPGLAFRDRDAPTHTDFRLRGRATALGSELMGGLVRGLVVGLVVGLTLGLEVGLLFALEFGLALGLATSRTCWSAFVLASLWLGIRRRLPFALMGFLNDAYRLGLLRIVGPVYQFRHAVLQDHLAPQPTEREGSTDEHNQQRPGQGVPTESRSGDS